MYVKVFLAVTFLLGLYLWHVHRALESTPDEARGLAQPPWTKEMVEDEYRRAQTETTDVRPFLFDRKNRRYVVVGGSGLVGGWIVQHLLMRGEDPAGIRIIDIKPTARKAVLEKNVDFIQTDVTDPTAVLSAFQTPWPKHVQSLPLTVFHCVAYINSSERKPEFTAVYEKVNIKGTENVIRAARTSGASILIATSSASISLVATSYFPWPWESLPKNYWQLLPNADREPLIRPLEDYGSCYSWSKAAAEHSVRQANNPEANFLTGCIRPGHAIYGHGGAYEFSLTWDYLRRGGSPSWIGHIVVNLVNAQNVSIGHLAYEDTLLKSSVATSSVSGNAYAVTDPNPAIRYGDLYTTLHTLAHPKTPANFSPIPVLTFLLPSYVLEAYRVLRLRIPALTSLLPDLKGELARVMPGMFQMCTLHTVFTDTKAQEEIGYRAPIGSLEGIVFAVLEWNRGVEEGMEREKKMNGKVDTGMDLSAKNANMIPNGSPVR